MKYDRDEMLSSFLANEDLIRLSKLSETELSKVSFADDSGDILIETLKSLLIAFCNGESEILTLRQANLRIDALSQ